MCLSTVWTAERQPVCKNVASVTQKDGQLVFTDIMGIPTVVNGQIEKIDLMENEIIIRKATAGGRLLFCLPVKQKRKPLRAFFFICS